MVLTAIASNKEIRRGLSAMPRSLENLFKIFPEKKKKIYCKCFFKNTFDLLMKIFSIIWTTKIWSWYGFFQDATHSTMANKKKQISTEYRLDGSSKTSSTINSNLPYAHVTTSFPSKKQAIIFDTIDHSKLGDYIIVAIENIAAPKNIMAASRISNNRICVYLEAIADKFIEEYKGFTIQDTFVVSTKRSSFFSAVESQ